MSVAPPLTFTDHVYQVADGHPITLRIWPNPKSSSESPSPIILWFHGGGWIEGARYVVKPWALEGFLGLGYTFVSVDYRLMPQVHLQDMLQDALDAYAWVRETINIDMASGFADVGRIAVGGHSAGATLAALLGVHAKPSPKVVLNLYGIVDFVKPPMLNDKHSASQFPGSGKNSDDYLASIVSRPSNVEVISHCPRPPTEAGYENIPTPPDFEFTDRLWLQIDLKEYLMRVGGLINVLLGFKLGDDGGAEFKAAAKKLSVLHLLDGPDSYPPTYVVHGVDDTIVEVEQSNRFVEALKAKGVAADYSRIEGGQHGCDKTWTNGSDASRAQIDAALKFADRFVRA